jgi:hypothetical protein
MNAILVNRALLIQQLNVDKDEFQSLLERANVEDADSFTEEEARKVKGAYVSQNETARSRSAAPTRSLSASPTGNVAVTPGESMSPVDALRQHLQENIAQVKAQSQAALDEYDLQMQDVMTDVCQQVQDIQGYWTGEGFRGLMHSGLNTLETIEASPALSLPQG